jgi:histidyl-tRNA synthetase
MCALGRQGVRTEIDYGDRSLKSQMKRADKLGARYVLIIGDQEVAQGCASLRNMASREQSEIPLEHLVDTVRETIQPRAGFPGGPQLA